MTSEEGAVRVADVEEGKPTCDDGIEKAEARGAPAALLEAVLVAVDEVHRQHREPFEM